MPVESLIVHYGIPIVAALILCNELGIPTGVPAEITLLLAGSYAVHSMSELLLALALVAAADLVGTTMLHLIARFGGLRLLKHLRRHEARLNATMDRWHQRVGGHETVTVFVTRLLPLVRMWAAIGAGLLRFRLRNFLFGAAPAALLWTGIPICLGYIFQSDVQRLEARYTLAAHAIMIALPTVAITSSLVLWIRAGGTATRRFRRARCAFGMVGAVCGGAYLVKTVWANQSLLAHYHLASPQPPLVMWVTLLALVVVALLWLAVADLRATSRSVRPRMSVTRLVMLEATATLTWIGLLGVAGAMFLAIDGGRLPVP